MGGTPILALNLVTWPRDALAFELLARVLDGGADATRAAGCVIAGGTQRNHAFVAGEIDFGELPRSEKLLLADAQTSGGLLLSVAPERAVRLLDACRERSTLAASAIGSVGTYTGSGARITLDDRGGRRG